jgi:hypothetical protein
MEVIVFALNVLNIKDRASHGLIPDRVENDSWGVKGQGN